MIEEHASIHGGAREPQVIDEDGRQPLVPLAAALLQTIQWSSQTQHGVSTTPIVLESTPLKRGFGAVRGMLGLVSLRLRLVFAIARNDNGGIWSSNGALRSRFRFG